MAQPRNFDAFVSAVTGECGKARAQVAAELRKQGLRVAIQEDFQQRPAQISLLRKLHDAIASCREVHCLIGARLGAKPSRAEAEKYRDFLPAGWDEASYTQWEYFFAFACVPDRLWLYESTHDYQPDNADAEPPEAQAAQARFRALVRERSAPEPFTHIGDVRAAVLANRAQREEPASDMPAGPVTGFHRDVAVNALGGIVAGLVVAAILWAGSHWTASVNPALGWASLLASVCVGLAMGVVFVRYSMVLACGDTDARASYGRLRRRLEAGGLSAETYRRRLLAFLNWTDRFFGDAPSAEAVSARPPLWTAPAYDRCLLLALVYPVMTILLVWTVSGHSGPAESALGLGGGVGPWRRGAQLGLLCVMGVGIWRYAVEDGWRSWAWLAASGIAGAGAGAVAVALLSEKATKAGWQGAFLALLTIFLTFLCVFAPVYLATASNWSGSGPLLLFLGLLALINAPFDWFALGLTRYLLRRGLQREGFWPYAYAVVDAVAAAAVIAVLTIACIVGVQFFDAMATIGGGLNARILPLDRLFTGLRANPAEPEGWWIYFMLFSTMIPSLVNLTLAGASFVRGLPWLTAMVRAKMPASRPPAVHDRLWMTGVLTLQIFLGGLLGIAAQVILVWIVIGHILPVFGLDLLDLAEQTATLNLPAELIVPVGRMLGYF
jgi:hypothetical protein